MLSLLCFSLVPLRPLSDCLVTIFHGFFALPLHDGLSTPEPLVLKLLHLLPKCRAKVLLGDTERLSTILQGLANHIGLWVLLRVHEDVAQHGSRQRIGREAAKLLAELETSLRNNDIN